MKKGNGKMKRGGWEGIKFTVGSAGPRHIWRYDVLLLYSLNISSSFDILTVAKLISFPLLCQTTASIHISVNILKDHDRQRLEGCAGVRFAGVQPAD